MEKLKIGKIVGTHGLKGELKIRSNSDFADKRFKKGNEIIISYQNQDLVYKIITSRIHKGNYLVSFRDNQDINLVEKYIGSFVYGYKDDELLDADEYFYRLLPDSLPGTLPPDAWYDESHESYLRWWTAPRSQAGSVPDACG